MEELIERIGIPLFIQVVLEIWNGVFLLLMIFLMRIRTKTVENDMSRNIEIPYTKEIVIFFYAIFLYNVCNVIAVLSSGSTESLVLKYTKYAKRFSYFSTNV